MDDALGVLKGFRVRLCIESEKELQVLGCGWRIVTCQFRDNKVLLHHNGNIATMKRAVFKALIAANKRLRRVHYPSDWWSPIHPRTPRGRPQPDGLYIQQATR
jgi:hypothetical protein